MSFRHSTVEVLFVEARDEIELSVKVSLIPFRAPRRYESY